MQFFVLLLLYFSYCFTFDIASSINNYCLVGLAVASAIAEQVVLGSIPGSDNVVLLSISIWIFLVAVTNFVFVHYIGLKNTTGERWVCY